MRKPFRYPFDVEEGYSTAVHHVGVRHTAARSGWHREHISKHCASNREDISKQWDFAPPTADWLVNKQKWRKNFQSMIYTHVCGPIRAHIGSIQGTPAIFPSDCFVVSVAGGRKRRRLRCAHSISIFSRSRRHIGMDPGDIAHDFSCGFADRTRGWHLRRATENFAGAAV